MSRLISPPPSISRCYLLNSEVESVSVGNLVYFMSLQRRNVSSGVGPGFHIHIEVINSLLTGMKLDQE